MYEISITFPTVPACVSQLLRQQLVKHNLYHIYCVHIVYCQPLTDISYGNITCSLGDDGLPSYQDTCDIICNTGYALNGSTTRTCLGDRTWSGTDDECLKGNNNVLTARLVWL